VSVEVLAVAPWEVAAVARQLKHLIDKAWSRGGSVPQDEMIEAAEDCMACMWVALVDGKPAGVAFTSRCERPDGQIAIWVTRAGGDNGMAWAEPLRRRLHEFRKREGAALLAWRGRRGWARIYGLTSRKLQDDSWMFEDYDT
jgi:hypothetical protein